MECDTKATALWFVQKVERNKTLRTNVLLEQLLADSPSDTYEVHRCNVHLFVHAFRRIGGGRCLQFGGPLAYSPSLSSLPSLPAPLPLHLEVGPLIAAKGSGEAL